jgi:hypothetical protein
MTIIVFGVVMMIVMGLYIGLVKPKAYVVRTAIYAVTAITIAIIVGLTVLGVSNIMSGKG